jgi:hypothetical protein
VLRALGVNRVRLLTNNVGKVAGLRDNGIDVAQRIPLITTPSADNLRYLWTKQMRMDHDLVHDQISNRGQGWVARTVPGVRRNAVGEA